MLELQDIFHCFGEDFRSNNFVSFDAIKAMGAIEECRTKALGGHMDLCDSCGDTKISYNSCKNRNCPKCGNLKKEQWILDRNCEILPVTYFHTVFTIPHELNSLFLVNQKIMNSILLKAASETLTKLALDKKFLGAQIGVTMVLHTWGQNLSYHNHAHCIVSGGGLSPSGISFIRSGKKFFIPVKILSMVFRGKFVHYLKKAFYGKELSFFGECSSWEQETEFLLQIKGLYKKSWVVYCKKPFKATANIVEYLSRYTHKTAIYNNRLVAMDDTTVSFRYRDYRDENKVKLMTLEAMEFIRRFLMHVLPSGFQKIRYYGIISNRNRKTKLELCFKLCNLKMQNKVKLTAKELIMKVFGVDITICPTCGGNWITYSSILPVAG